MPTAMAPIPTVGAENKGAADNTVAVIGVPFNIALAKSALFRSAYPIQAALARARMTANRFTALNEDFLAKR